MSEAQSADVGRVTVFVGSIDDDTGALTSRSTQSQATVRPIPTTIAAANPARLRSRAQRASPPGRRRSPRAGWDVDRADTASASASSRGRPQGSPGDVRLFRQVAPPGCPLGDVEAELLAQARNLRRERLADLVVVADLQPQLAVTLVPR